MSTSDQNQFSETALTLNRNGNLSSPSHDAATGQLDGEADHVAAQRPQEGRTKQMERYFRYDKERDKPNVVRTAPLTVAVLMATATYQAGVSPPGGVWQDNNLSVNPKHRAGVSIMATNSYFACAWFTFWNSLGFYSSLDTIGFLTRGFPLQLELTFAAVGMIFTYCSSMVAVAPYRSLGNAFNGMSFALPLSLPYIVRFLRDSKVARKIRKTVNGFRTTQRLLPL